MKKPSRRKFITDVAATTCAFGVMSLLGACKSDPPAETPAVDKTPVDEGPICDMAKVSDTDKATRTALGYIDKTADPSQTCENCNLYVADVGGCTGCTLFKGPVEPLGWCNSWIIKG